MPAEFSDRRIKAMDRILEVVFIFDVYFNDFVSEIFTFNYQCNTYIFSKNLVLCCPRLTEPSKAEAAS